MRINSRMYCIVDLLCLGAKPRALVRAQTLALTTPHQGELARQREVA